MLPPRSIAARSPALDREVLRAILNPRGPWARDVEALARQIGTLLDRPARWVAQPEDALLAALAARVDRLHVAMPAFGHPGFEGTRLRADARMSWMEPALHRFDPGPSEVAAALDAGANAVLLTPLAGDCSALPAVRKLCDDNGAVLAVDARASMAARVLDGGPTDWSELSLAPVDGEGGPSPCPGAILLGDDEPTAAPRARLSPGLLLRTVRASLRDEPHVRRFLRPGPATTPPLIGQPAAPWAVAAASARAADAAHRNTQRARHARSLQVHCSHVAAVRVPPIAKGHQSAGLAVPMLARRRDEVVSHLLDSGVEPVQDLGGWLAPPEDRGPRAQELADSLLAVPLHPFYRPRDLDWLAERLRQATLRANGDGAGDPTETVPYAAKAAGEL